MEKKRAAAQASRFAPKAPPQVTPLTTYPLKDYAGHVPAGHSWDEGDLLHVAHVLAGYLKQKNFQILDMPTGFGKTSIAVAAAAQHQKNVGRAVPVFVVASRAIIEAEIWQGTIMSYNQSHPDNPLSVYAIETTDRMAILDSDDSFRDQTRADMAGGIFLVDEVHRFKNPTAKRTKGLRSLSKNAKVLGVSGTPITNNPALDVCSYAVLAGEFRSKNSFLEKTGLKPLTTRYFNHFNIYNSR
uniref:DEAD/DEAH box helicase family protein n=1 Tax=Corynebacterium mastitidis TaxID=161890 RepID=UPI00146165FF